MQACGKFCLPYVAGLTAAAVLTAGRDHHVRSAYLQPVHVTAYTASVTAAVRAAKKNNLFVHFDLQP